MTGRAVAVRLTGVCVVASAGLALRVVATDGDGHLGGAVTGEGATVYGPSQVLLALGLAAAGLVLLLGRGRDLRIATLAVAGLCAAQLAGAGLVASRRWPHYWGCCADDSVARPELVRDLALVMAAGCGLVGLVCLVLLLGAGLTRRSPSDPLVNIALAGGLLVAVAAPVLVDGFTLWVVDLAAWALMYSIPLGLALALTCLMPRPVALVVAGAVVVSAVIATLGSSFLELMQPWAAARPLVVLAALAVGASRVFERQLSPWRERGPISSRSS